MCNFLLILSQLMEKSRKLLFLDTETTVNTEADFLCQVAYQVDEEEIKEE